MAVLRSGVAGLVLATVLCAGQPAARAQEFGGISIETQDPCSPIASAGRDAHVDVACGMALADVARLVDEARSAVERGEFDIAEDMLRRADDEQAKANRLRQEALDRGRLRQAGLRADRANLAELRFRYPEAERLYQEAANLIPDSKPPR